MTLGDLPLPCQQMVEQIISIKIIGKSNIGYVFLREFWKSLLIENLEKKEIIKSFR